VTTHLLPTAHDAFYCPDSGLLLPPGAPLANAWDQGDAVFGLRWLGYRPHLRLWVRRAAPQLLAVARFGGRRSTAQGPDLIGLGPLHEVVDHGAYQAVSAAPLLNAELHDLLRRDAIDQLSVVVSDAPRRRPRTREALLFELSLDDAFAGEDRRLQVATCPHRPGDHAVFGAVDPALPHCPLCRQPYVFDATDGPTGGFGPHAPELAEGLVDGPLPGILILEPVLPPDHLWQPELEEDPWGPLLMLPGDLGAATTGTLSSLGLPGDRGADLPAGRNVAGYVLGDVRRRRGDATEHRATDDQGRPVDVLLGRIDVDALGLDLLGGIEREARWLSRLQHPALPRLLGYGAAAVDGVDRPLSILEAWDGINLRDVLAGAGAADEAETGAWWSVLPLTAALELGRQLASLACWLGDEQPDRPALAHGDLSPHHVGVDGQGRVRLTDLRSLERGGAEAAGRIDPAGDAAYREPGTTDRLDPAVDAFAIGAVLFEVLTSEQASALVPRRRRRGAERGLPDAARAELGYVLEEQGLAAEADAVETLLGDLMEGDAESRRAALLRLAQWPEQPWCTRSAGQAALGEAVAGVEAPNPQ